MIGDISVGYTLVPLDKVDLSLVSVLYTQVCLCLCVVVVGGWLGGRAVAGACSCQHTSLLAAVVCYSCGRAVCLPGGLPHGLFAFSWLLTSRAPAVPGRHRRATTPR